MRVAPWTPEDDERVLIEMIADPMVVVDRHWIAFDIAQSQRRGAPAQEALPPVKPPRKSTASRARSMVVWPVFHAEPGACRFCAHSLIGLDVLVDPRGIGHCPFCGSGPDPLSR